MEIFAKCHQALFRVPRVGLGTRLMGGCVVLSRFSHSANGNIQTFIEQTENVFCKIPLTTPCLPVSLQTRSSRMVPLLFVAHIDRRLLIIGDGKKVNGGCQTASGKGTCYWIALLPGFIGDSIVSTPWYLVFWNAHITEQRSISGDGSLFLEDKTLHLIHVYQSGRHTTIGALILHRSKNNYF